MPPASTALVTALVGLVYVADVFFGHRPPMTAQIALQLLVFVGVAGVTAYFSSRVSVMGAEREALAGELRQARPQGGHGVRHIPHRGGTADPGGHPAVLQPPPGGILGVHGGARARPAVAA